MKIVNNWCNSDKNWRSRCQKPGMEFRNEIQF